jgi:hypothetical protein
VAFETNCRVDPGTRTQTRAESRKIARSKALDSARDEAIAAGRQCGMWSHHKDRRPTHGYAATRENDRDRCPQRARERT